MFTLKGVSAMTVAVGAGLVLGGGCTVHTDEPEQRAEGDPTSSTEPPNTDEVESAVVGARHCEPEWRCRQGDRRWRWSGRHCCVRRY